MRHNERMTKQCCGTCNMASFALTPTGRFKQDATSRCGYHIQMPVLPTSYGQQDYQREPDFLDRHKTAVSPDSGTDCPVYAPKK
jgi:hypothetical protein